MTRVAVTSPAPCNAPLPADRAAVVPCAASPAGACARRPIPAGAPASAGSWVACLGAGLLGLMWALSPTPAFACAEGRAACIVGDAKTTIAIGERLNSTARAKERKRTAKRRPVIVHIELLAGRGSVFIDGRWMGVAPLEDLELAPGKHDIQVRDGARVVVEGVLKISDTAKTVTVQVQGD